MQVHPWSLSIFNSKSRPSQTVMNGQLMLTVLIDHPYTPTNIENLYKIINYAYTYALLHVSAINRHPQTDTTQRHTKTTHAIYICSVKSKSLKVNSGSHKDKNVDIIDNVMLPYC
jgi:hypothetical protein